jgi:hypothetical protein
MKSLIACAMSSSIYRSSATLRAGCGTKRLAEKGFIVYDTTGLYGGYHPAKLNQQVPLLTDQVACTLRFSMI